MKLITSLFDCEGREYTKMAKNLDLSAKKAGYAGVQVVGLEEDPITEFVHKGNYKVPCHFKPNIIRLMLEMYKDDVVWLDADCLVVSRFDELLSNTDMAFTMRRITQNRSFYDGLLNAGVVAFRYTPGAIEFLDRWIKELPNGFSDQDALARLISEGFAFDKYGTGIFSNVGKTVVSAMACDFYNFVYLPEEPKAAKIIHVKGHQRKESYNALATKILGEQACLLEN